MPLLLLRLRTQRTGSVDKPYSRVDGGAVAHAWAGCPAEDAARPVCRLALTPRSNVANPREKQIITAPETRDMLRGSAATLGSTTTLHGARCRSWRENMKVQRGSRGFPEELATRLARREPVPGGWGEGAVLPRVGAAGSLLGAGKGLRCHLGKTMTYCRE